MLRVCPAGALKADGTYQGCYVYLLLCEADGAVYVKAGMSNDPVGRIQQLLVGCPLVPGILASAELLNRGIARRAERALHVAFAEWHTNREWFRVPLHDRERFNAARRIAMEGFALRGRPIMWTKLGLAPLLAILRQRQAVAARKAKRGGASFRDFCRDSSHRGFL